MSGQRAAYFTAAAMAALAHLAVLAFYQASPEPLRRAAPRERGVQIELAAAPEQRPAPPLPATAPARPASPAKPRPQAAPPAAKAVPAPAPAQPAAPSAPAIQPGAESEDSGPQNLGPPVNPAPQYPAALRKLGREGTVKLLVRVDAGGHVREVKITQSSGQMPFDRAALAAVRKWRYKPATRFGKAVPGEAAETVIFRLDAAQK